MKLCAVCDVLVILLVWETEGGYGIYTPWFGAMPRGRRRLVCIGARSYWVLENDDWSSGNLLQLGQCSSHVL
jgi:hypothetical protein